MHVFSAGWPLHEARFWRQLPRAQELPSHVPCRSGCGRYTLSKTRYCNKCGPGVNGHQQVVALQMRKKQLQCEAEWDAYIDKCMKSADGAGPNELRASVWGLTLCGTSCYSVQFDDVTVRRGTLAVSGSCLGGGVISPSTSRVAG